jgi:hypothetical protein
MSEQRDKAIKEIGRTMWAYEKWREQSNIDLISRQKELNPDAVVVMSLEERRELVRRVWEAAFENEHKRSISRPFEFPQTIEQFIESENL